MAAWEGKKYKLDKSENFDEYMKAIGVGMMMRKIGNTLSPVVELTKNGDEYTLTSSSAAKTTVIKFKEGVEFDEETLDGRKIRSVCTFENPNKLIHQEKGDKPTTLVREFTETELIITLTIGNVKAVRYYKVV